MKVRVRPDIIEYLEKQGYKQDGDGDWYSLSDNDEFFINDMMIAEPFDVVEIGQQKYYTEKYDYTYKEDWLIFVDDIIQITQKDTTKEEYLIEAVAEMKKEIDFLKDVIRYLIKE